MPIAKVNSQLIYYADSGGNHPAVIFAHGFFMDHTMFDAQVEILSKRFRCIAWDQRGFGKTAAPARSAIGIQHRMLRRCWIIYK